MAKQRLLSLDVFRGLAVIGMIFVNSVAVFHYRADVPAYGLFLHAPWAGLTVADLVFPFFIFMVGVSLPFALPAEKGLPARAVVLKLLKRACLLFLIGLALTLSFADWGQPIRLLGVLQRIGLTFLGAALFFISFGWRAQVAAIIVILAGYAVLQMTPFPDVPLDLMAPGQNFSSWFDRLVLGDHVYARNAAVPYEPEGLLGTLPSIAQALMGALTGTLIRARGCTKATLRQLCAAGLVFTVLGFALAPLHPIVKATWSSTFVLATSGLALLVFAALIWCLDIKGWRGSCATFAQAFGINAITAYVAHTYLMAPLLLNDGTLALQEKLSSLLPAELAMLVPVMVVVLVSWTPVALMKRKGIILKV
ncbi:acyltransferase family protein [Kordiimonas sp.]|uniref:acyltransferase family protein n=1 Tax=Kordiimonas sp. TaxID=1970157 RepID=UPI003A9548A0